MFAFLRFILWTGCAVGLGIFLATAQVGGETPYEMMRRSWKKHATPDAVQRLREGVNSLVHQAKDALSAEEPFAPRERHTAQDRAEINKLIANSAAAK